MEHLRHTDQSAPVATPFFPPRLERVIAIVSDRWRLPHARFEPATMAQQRNRIYERNLFLPFAVRGLRSGRSPYTEKWSRPIEIYFNGSAPKSRHPALQCLALEWPRPAHCALIGTILGRYAMLY